MDHQKKIKFIEEVFISHMRRPGDTIWLAPGVEHRVEDVKVEWALHLRGGGIYPEDTEQPVRFERVTLSGARVGDDPPTVQLLQHYQQRLREQRVVSAQAPDSTPLGAPCVGARKSGECHQK